MYMKKEVYILKPVIQKTGKTHNYTVYTCVDFALFHKREMVDDGYDCFADLPINSRAKSRKAFDNIDLSESIGRANYLFGQFCHLHLGGDVKFSTKCAGNKFIFSI